MFTATKDLMLPATVTGSWPRPRWYDGGLWGRPLDTALLDVKFREQFLDAHSTVIADQERAGLDILTNGDYHLDEDFAGRSWHHYPLQRWKGLEHEELQYGSSRDAPAGLPAGHADERDRDARGAGRASSARSSTTRRTRSSTPSCGASPRRAPRSGKPVKFGTCSSQVLVDLPRLPHVRVRPRRQEAAHLGHGHGHEHGAPPARRRRRQGHPDRGADDPLHRLLPPRGEGDARLHGRGVQPRGRRARRRRAVDPHLLGQPEHAEGLQRRVVRELDRHLPQPAQGRRLDGRDDRARVRRDRPVQAVRQQPVEEGRGRRRQPPTAAGRPARRSSPDAFARRSTSSRPTSWCCPPTAASAARASTGSSRSTRPPASPRAATSCSRSWGSSRVTSRPPTRHCRPTCYPTASR